MADPNKDAAKPAQKDAKANQSEEVHVTVTPKNPQNPDDRKAAEKVKTAVKEGVKKALDDNRGGGVKRQLDAAEQKVDEAKERTSPQKIEKINVKVKVKDSEGDETTREKTVKPKEGGGS